MKHNLSEFKRVVEASKDDQRACPGPDNRATHRTRRRHRDRTAHLKASHQDARCARLAVYEIELALR
jgi:hypothetical protein